VSAAEGRDGALIRVDSIHTYYGKSHILHGVSLQVMPGEGRGLLAGRRGQEHHAQDHMGLIHPTEGTVALDGRPITRMPAHRLARLGIGLRARGPPHLRLLTVMENLRTGLDRHGVTDETRRSLLDKVLRVLPRAGGAPQPGRRHPLRGEQQMLAIARAMMLERRSSSSTSPREGLMPRMVAQISQIIHALHRERRGDPAGGTERAAPPSRRARRLHHGEGVVRHQAPASELRHDDAVIHQYLGV